MHELSVLVGVVAVGFLLGIRHATDPDHVIAVTTIVTREGEVKRAALIGAAWGIGHTLTIMVVGSAMILFRLALPPRLGLAMELAVGLMLIILGFSNLRALFGSTAVHAHGDYVHAHTHPHEHHHPHNPQQNPVAALDRRFQRFGAYRWIRPLIVGIVHGLAGSAAIALLVLSTIPTAGWAMAYLAVFGIGTILGMMLITLTIGSTVAFGHRRFVHIGRHFSLAAGVISIVFGIFVAYQTGIVGGLFTSNVHWTPR